MIEKPKNRVKNGLKLNYLTITCKNGPGNQAIMRVFRGRSRNGARSRQGIATQLLVFDICAVCFNVEMEHARGRALLLLL